MPVDNTDAIDESSRKFMDLWKKMYPQEQDPELPPLDTAVRVKEPDGKIAPIPNDAIRVRDDAKDEKELETAKSGGAAAPGADVPSTQTDSESAAAPKPALTPEQKFMNLTASKAQAPAGMPAANEPDWKKLQSNLEAAQNRANWTRIQDKSFATNLPAGAVHVDEHAGENDIAAARAPLEIAQARQKYGLEQAQLEDTKAQAEQRKAAADAGAQSRDPNSPQSQKAVAAVKASGLIPDSLNVDGWSAAEVAQFIKDPFVEIAKLKSAEKIAAGKKNQDQAKKDQSDAEWRAGIEGSGRYDDLVKSLKSKPGVGDGKSAWDSLGREEGQNLIHDSAQQRGIDARTAAEKAKGDPGNVRPGQIQTVPPDIRETVQAVADGRFPAPDPKDRYGAKILNAVTKLDPNFDSTRFTSYQKNREKIENDPAISAGNTAIDHMRTALEQIPEDQSNPQFLNKLRNWVKTGSGDPSISAFTNTLQTVGGELATAYNEATEGGRQRMEDMFNKAQSPEQLKAALENQINLLDTRNRNKYLQFKQHAPKGTANPIPDPSSGPVSHAPAKKDLPNPFLK